jgi:hypothetical protein
MGVGWPLRSFGASGIVGGPAGVDVEIVLRNPTAVIAVAAPNDWDLFELVGCDIGILSGSRCSAPG